MNVSSLIAALKNQGIKIQFVDGNLKISDPGDKLTPQLLAEIKEKKAQIIAFFNKYARQQDGFAAISAAEKKEYYPLSSAQRRLYIVQRMADDSISYNMPSVLELIGTIDKERMTAAFQGLVMRHESFRTGFRQVGEEPVQIICNPGEVEFKIEYYSGERDSMKRFIRPFDLTRAPLLRVGLIEGADAVPRFLMIDMHHIISDGTSIATIIREFMALYAAHDLPYLRIQYKEYSQWQRSDRQKKAVKKQEVFWLNRFAGEIPVLNLPTDYTRPPIQSFKGESVHFEIEESQTGRLKAAAVEADATLYIVLLSITAAWLGKLTGQEEIIVGTPVAGRGHTDLENIIGMFVNTLALWNYPAGDKPFRDFLEEVKNVTIAAFANQDYQFEDLVEKAAIARDMSRNPIFDFMFSLQNLGIPKIDSLPIQMRSYPYEVGVAKFDLALDVVEEAGSIYARIDYSTALFNRETVERFGIYFKEIVSSVLANPSRQLRQIEMIPQIEKDRLLYEFNDTAAEYPKDKSIHQVFAEQVKQSPHRTAVADIGQKTNSQVHLTYRELDRRAQGLAGLLVQKGAMPGAVAALTAESRIEMIIALLGILKAGAAYLPIDPAYPEDRKNYILDDSGAPALVYTGASHDNDWRIENRRGHVVESTRAFFPGRLAYIIYTSGTTGRPKGVMIEHSSVLRLVKNPNFMEFREGKRLLMTGALVFDISTLEIWGPLLNGLTLYIIAKEATLAPGKLSEAIINNDISILHLIPQLFNHVFEHTPHGFSRLEYFLVGGDLVRHEPVFRLRKMYPNLKIVHAYGPTENTTFSTTYAVDKNHGEKLPIGKPISNSSVYILDRYGDLQPTGVPGELYVGGDGLSRGYLNNPELTAEKFVAFGESEPFCKKVPTPPKTFDKSFLGVKGAIFQKSPLVSIYKTGDLARWLPDGNIEFLGRMDFQVKIRGMRIELGEIENRLRTHGDIKDAVVLDINAAGGEKYLCAYIVSKDRQEIAAPLLRDYLSPALPDYMIPAHFIFIDSIPLNPNGKVDRKVLPIPEFQAAAEYTPPTNETEEKLAEIWSSVLNIPANTIGIDANFFEIGGHSLKATTLVYKIEKAFDATIGIKDIFTYSTIRKLAARVKELEIVEYTRITPAKEKEYYILSSAQKRLYVLQQSDKGSTSYNIPMAMQLTGSLDRERLETALHRLIARHESLRTSFHLTADAPMQKIHDPEKIEFAVEYYESPGIHQIISRFIRPFDLTQAPLLRVGLITTTTHDAVAIKAGDSPTRILMLDIHHIISDGTSIGIFAREFLTLYDGQELAPLHLQYKDYAEWQNNAKQQNKIDAQAGYWLMQFSGEIPVLELPTDFPRPVEKSFVGSMTPFTLGKEQTAALNDLARTREATLFMVLLAVYHILLAKLSRQEDIVIGVPTAGRRHADLEPLIGMFINTLALRNNTAGEKTFATFLAEIKERTLAAFENQDYPYENLVERLSPAYGNIRSRNPLFDVMLALQNVTIPELHIHGLTIAPYPFEMGTAKFDQTLIATETNDIIHFELEYSTKLFTADTGRRFITYFEKIVTQVLAKPDIKISDIEIISEEEKHRLLYDFNNEVPPYTTDKTIQGLFATQAARTPDHIAVIGMEKNRQMLQRESSTLSYRELNEAADWMAAALVEKGVCPGEIVGIMAERSIQMIFGILGILKAGAAYLPINPRNPADRTNFMLKDCSVTLLLTTPGIVKEAEHLSSVGVVEKMIIEAPRGEPGMRAVRDSSGQLAYVIYTSGSTGMPKGVPIAHANFCPLMYWGYDYLGLGGQDRVIQNLSYYFDWSVWEIFIALTSGAALYMIDEEILLNPEAEVAFIRENRISVLHITPSQYHYLINVGEKLDSLRYLCLGAEKLTYDMLERSLASVNENCRVFNMYGPTEATIISAALEIDRLGYREYKNLSSIPIGQPSANLQLHVLDKNLLLSPMNTPGQLYIAGGGVSAGYLNNPELTAERFAAFGESEPFCKKVPTPPKTFNESFLGVKGAIFQKSPLAAGGNNNIYRTGDLACWLPGGNIEFLGRMDFQVKVRGYRIEPGEIENRLLSHNRIKEALVQVGHYDNGEKYVCAYLVLEKKGTLPSFEPAPTIAAIREYIADRLPPYMIPDYFVELEQMPLNPNGKVDLIALPQPHLLAQKQEVRVDFTPPQSQMEKTIAAVWQEILGLEQIGIHDRFFDIGGNSLKVIQMIPKLTREIGLEIPVEKIFQFPTISSLARHLSEQSTASTAGMPQREKNFEIAVIGMQVRFPGADNTAAFWENLKKGVESISVFSLQELAETGVADEMLANPNYVKAVGFLEGCEYFDAAFFDYTPREAQYMSPQLRIYHECCWAAFEDAGYNPETYPGRIGVFAGASLDSAWIIGLLQQMESPSQQFEIVNMNNISSYATLISYNFNLRGPSVSLHTACSTSLVAVHYACLSLINGDCDIALAGGAAVDSRGKSGYLYQEGMIGSPDGHCRAFDARAFGAVSGSGVGVVTLKPLKQALEHRDQVYAVIIGTAVNNDGKEKVGYTAPGVTGQANAVAGAMRTAHAAPESIGYIETHGTGTALGDVVEIAALKLAFASQGKKSCALGSVKTNIGHLDAAAGIAGLIKTALSLKNCIIPPSLNFETPNPAIDFANSPFFVNNRLLPWKSGANPRRAGVSSFGIGGTNAHAVLQEAPPLLESAPGKPWKLLLLSARTPAVLERATSDLTAHLQAHPTLDLADAAYTLQIGRKHHTHRRMVVCSDAADALAILSAPSPARLKTATAAHENIPLVFMFPPHGHQYVNMGLELYQAEPLFRQEMDRCFEISELLLDYDLKAILYPSLMSDEADESNRPNRSNRTNKSYKPHDFDIDRIEISQPIIFCFEYALARLLMSWGLRPQVMIGYSFGEYVAAAISGIFSLADALRLVVLRARLIQESPQGAMLSVPLPEKEVTPILSSRPTNDLFLAVVNEDACIVSGSPQAIESFEKELLAGRVLCMRINVQQAGHSPMLNSVLYPFREAIGRVGLNKPEIPIISGITGAPISEQEACDPTYWLRHLSETIRFTDGVRTISSTQDYYFLEVGPGRDLSILAQRMIKGKTGSRIFNLVPQGREAASNLRYFLERIGRLWLCGISIDWHAFSAYEKRRRISLPTYSFEKQRYPLAAAVPRQAHAGRTAVQAEPAARQSQFPFQPQTVSLAAEAARTGKMTTVDRAGLDVEYQAPQGRVQQTLTALWEDFFGVQPIGAQDDFFDLGGDSLKAVTIISKIHKSLDVEISPTQFFNHPTIAALAGYIAHAARSRFARINSVERKEYYPLSPAQRRLYVLFRMEPHSTAYNLPAVFKVKGAALSLEKTTDVFRQLIHRHEILRTAFDEIAGEPVQRVFHQVEFKIDYFATDEQAAKDIVIGFLKPFDLKQPPLMRVASIEINPEERLLLFDIHHIVYDGISQGIFFQEFMELYKGASLPDFNASYKDYAGWRSSLGQQALLKVQQEYWHNRFAGDIPVLNLPYDFTRPPVKSFAGDVLHSSITEEATRSLKRFAQERQVTMYMILLAAFNILLAKLTGQEDIVVGTPLSGRKHVDTENLIGMFVNTLALRYEPTEDKPFPVFLQQVREQTLKDFENQDYQFENLVDSLNLTRDLSRNPIFDVMFAFQEMEGEELEVPALKLVPQEYEIRPALFDLVLHALETGDKLSFTFEYDTKLFKASTIERFMDYFKMIAVHLPENPRMKIGEIEILDEAEKNRLLYDFNGPLAHYPREQTMHRLFSRQVERTPHRICLSSVLSTGDEHGVSISHRLQLTYRRLDDESGRLAVGLQNQGLRSGMIAALMVERSVEMIIGIIGILKTGAAYLPIDPAAPPGRKTYMLTDSSARFLVSTPDFFDKNWNIKNWHGDVVFIGRGESVQSLDAMQSPASTDSPLDPAYVIFTSGSTGKPKGVIISHANFCPLMYWGYSTLGIGPAERTLQNLSYHFDWSVWEIFITLTTGAALHIVPGEALLDPAACIDYITVDTITIFHVTPGRYQYLAADGEKLPGLKYLFIGAEKLSYDLVERSFALVDDRCRVFNMYGPTEATIISTVLEIDRQGYKDFRKLSSVPIGRPIADLRLLVLDKSFRLRPVEAVGELYISGPGVARGYLNNPELTAEKFVISHSKFSTNDRCPMTDDRLYRTGDMVRWLPDGNIEFISRIDHQVKIRGFRIELGEIETRLLEYEQIKEAVVIDRQNQAGEKYLCAYLTGQNISSQAIKEYLARVLPVYMIPQYFVLLDKIPLTPNGKVDRKALPQPEISVTEAYTAPRDEVEEELQALWAETLGLEKEMIGITDDFFKIGGHSLKAAIIAAKIHEIFNIKMSLGEFFKTPTIREIAGMIKVIQFSGDGAQGKKANPDQAFDTAMDIEEVVL